MANRTLAQSRARVRARLADPNAKIWSNTTIDTYIKESYDVFTLNTKFLFSRANLADVAGQGLYNLPSDFQSLSRCEWKNRAIPPVRGNEMAANDSEYETSQGDVIAFMMDGDGIGKIRKIRVPAASHATNFKIEYFRRGATLSTDGTEFETPDWATDIIELRALAMCYEKEGDGQDLDKASHFRLRYESKVARTKSRISKLLKMRCGVVGGGTMPTSIGRPRFPHNYAKPTRY